MEPQREEVDFKRKGVGLVNTNSDAFAAFKAKRAAKRLQEERLDTLEQAIHRIENKLDRILKALDPNGETNIPS